MKKILFIGNSHTYFNDMPYMVKYLAKSSGQDVDITMLTKAGQNLAGHLADEQVRFNILYGEYDYIVFQEVVSGFPGEEIYRNNLHNLLQYVYKTNAKPFIYMVWAPEFEAEKFNELIRACDNVGKIENVSVSRVGALWKKCMKEYPEIPIYYKDHRHASPIGSYFVALCLIKTILDISTIGLPNAIKHNDDILVFIQETTATTLQQLVEENS